MNLRPDQLAAQLERPLAPLWLLHGNEPLLVLEAMKMENEITAHKAGVIKSLPISEGEPINAGDPIAVIVAAG